MPTGDKMKHTFSHEHNIEHDRTNKSIVGLQHTYSLCHNITQVQESMNDTSTIMKLAANVII